VIYDGPHTAYVGREICFAYNQDKLTIVDVTDKLNPTLISNTGKHLLTNARSHRTQPSHAALYAIIRIALHQQIQTQQQCPYH
jgi:hypothetical protein